MDGNLSRIKNYFINTFQHGENLMINQITKRNTPFFIGWIAIILWLDCYALPIGSVGDANLLSKISPTNIFSYLYPLTVIAIVCLFDVRKLLPYVKYCAVVAMIGILAGNVTGNTHILYIGNVLAAIAVGNIIVATDYGFFMVMNNVERLYSVSIGIIISKIILLFKVSFVGSSNSVNFFEIMQIAGFVPLFFCVWFYQKATSKEMFDLGKKPQYKYYTVLALACLVFLFNDFLAPILWKEVTAIQPFTLNMWHAAGVFLGVIITILLQQVLGCNICYVLNSSFALLAMGFVIGALEYRSMNLALFQAFLFGVSYAMGFVSIYYIIGIIAKKSQSMFFFRIGIMSVGLFYILGFFITEIIKNINSQILFSATAFLSLAVILIVFALTPLITKTFYSAEWTDDLFRLDVTHVSRLAACLADLKLSPREIEVCILLLDGYTMRQISAMLNIAYSTVNTYYTSIYRKLGVNSRAELIVMFSEYSAK